MGVSRTHECTQRCGRATAAGGRLDDVHHRGRHVSNSVPLYHDSYHPGCDWMARHGVHHMHDEQDIKTDSQ